MKCPVCGTKIPKSRAIKQVDADRVARDLLQGWTKGLQGDALLKYARRSLPKAAA